MLSYDTYDERWIPSKMRRPFRVIPYGPTYRTASDGSWMDRPGANKHFPDVAIPLELKPAFSISPNHSQSIWCDIYIPQDAPAGTYTGTVAISEHGTIAKQVPIALEVRNFALPDVPHATALVSLGDYDIAERYLGRAYRFADYNTSEYRRLLPILRRHWQLLHRHKIVPAVDESHGVAPPKREGMERISGRLYSRENGYDGPGRDRGDAVYMIAPYGGWPWKNSDVGTYAVQSGRWMTWFAANAPNVRRYLYLVDEPDPKNTAQMLEIDSWLSKLEAGGSKLPTFITMSPIAVR